MAHDSRQRAQLTILIAAVAISATAVRAQDEESLQPRMDALEAEIGLAEDMSALKRLQRIYGFYVDKGMWEDVADLFTDDAVANYPAGVYIGRDSIRRHLFMNVGGGDIGDNGLGDNRLYNHMNIQPVVHIDADGQTAQGRWRAFAYFGSLGRNAVWAEGVYEMGYVKQDGVWKISTLDYHSGFGAPYATGWVDPGEPRQRGGPRNLPHPADRERSTACDGFPAACVGPFHYENLGKSAAAHAWFSPLPEAHGARRASVMSRATELARRARILADEQAIQNLIKIYGYYLDRRMWDHVTDLFADDGTIEMDLRGVYEGKDHIRSFLDLLGPAGLQDGDVNDHVQLQFVVDVAPDGLTAKSRSREFDMTGKYESHGEWSEGIYNNTYVKEDGIWKIRSLRYYPTFITDYDKGWGEDAQPAPGLSTVFPPDLPPSDIYEIYPKAHIPPYHYVNPVSGARPRYPREAGRPSNDEIQSVTRSLGRVQREAEVENPEAAISAAEKTIARVKDYHELENLKNAYGYYLDKNLWNDLADLFAADGSMELAQRGKFIGRERVRQSLFSAFGPEGPVAGRLGNHVQMQPVINVSDDGRSAKIRSRMMQQLAFGPRASMGAAVYEDEAVKEDGVWRFKTVHAYNTWTAGYAGGWARNPGTYLPGPNPTYPPDEPPSLKFSMYPAVYELPFHYDNPVSGRASNSKDLERTLHSRNFDGYMPPPVAARLREVGPRIDAQATARIYAPLHSGAVYAGSVARDLSYGPDDRNTLDVFTKFARGDSRPVLVFVYGGGFRGGSKSSPGSPFYDNVMHWAVEHGMVGVNVNYRLAPEHSWPSGIEDIGNVMQWIGDNILRYGGNPREVILWGHSSGGAHVADYLAAQARRGEDDGVAGAVLLSSFYELGDEVSVWSAYYGDDVASYEERSSLSALASSPTPLMVVDADLDPEMFQEQAVLLTQARAETELPLRRLHLAGHSHLSEGYAVGTADRSLTGPVLQFIETVLEGAPLSAR